MNISINNSVASIDGRYADNTQFQSVIGNERVVNSQLGFYLAANNFTVNVSGFQANSISNGFQTSYSLSIEQASVNRIVYEHPRLKVRAIRDGGCTGNTDFSGGQGEKNLTRG